MQRQNLWILLSLGVVSSFSLMATWGKAAENDAAAESNPEVVAKIMELVQPIRQQLGEFMQRGSSQRPAGSLFPQVPVISHEKDWETLDPATIKEIIARRDQLHPNRKPARAKPRQKKRQKKRQKAS